MIKLYSWSTPNGRKVSIMLEELGVKYSVIPINISKDEQFTKEFQQISPTNKIPAIVDSENNQYVFESGSILLYLAKKYNNFFNFHKEWETYSWLMYQMSEVGPFLGQAHQFLYYNKGKSAYAEDRFRDRAKLIYNKINNHLDSNEYFIEDYSIVDIAIWPWIARYERQEINIAEYSNIKRWFNKIAKRSAVIKGYNVVGKKEEIPIF